MDREIFTLKIIRVKNFRVVKFSWFLSIRKLFLTVDDCNIDECLETCWRLVYYQVSEEPGIARCSRRSDIYLGECGLARKLIQWSSPRTVILLNYFNSEIFSQSTIVITILCSSTQQLLQTSIKTMNNGWTTLSSESFQLLKNWILVHKCICILKFNCWTTVHCLQGSSEHKLWACHYTLGLALLKNTSCYYVCTDGETSHHFGREEQ